MINPKTLKEGDVVWFARISFAKSPTRCSLKTLPTECVVWKIETYKDWAARECKSIKIITKSSVGLDRPRIIYEIVDYEYDHGEAYYLFKTKEDAVSYYNRVVNNQLDYLQSCIDTVKKKLIK